jgi:cytochrome c oxidase subunit 1
MSATTTHDHHDEHHAPEPQGYHKFLHRTIWKVTPDFVWKWVFSQDHKVIGIQYAVTALCFLLFGFGLMMLMRMQLAYPNAQYPAPALVHWFQLFFTKVLGENRIQDGYLQPEFYNQLGAMHGTIMIFLGVVPLAVGGFGNFVVPLQVGAPDMAFPRLNMASYWSYFIGGVIMLASFFVPGGAAQSGWTSYPPLSDIASAGQTWWGFGMVFLITSSLLGSINIIVTIVQMRAPGLSMFRLPFFVWAQLVTSFLLVLAFPPLEAAAILQLMDRVAGTSFFLPTGLKVSGHAVSIGGHIVAGGGNPILWQHLFWFLAHPEVYVLILPAMGIVAEVIANNTRKPLWGYRSAVYAIIFLGFMSFIVWAHHMFMTGMGVTMSTFFQTTTMIISVPSVIILTVFIISLYGGSIRYTVPMLFALTWMVMFAIGGLTGLPLGLTATDLHLHDTYYVIGHFHYVVAPGTLFALFAGIYYWYPKATGRMMNPTLGKLHFWLSLPSINLVFFPMLIEGMVGVNRRLFDQTIYSHGRAVQTMTQWQSWGAWVLGAAQLFFIVNFFWSLKRGEKIAENPWNATTLEWAAPSPPGHGNFPTPVQAFRGPYEYSVPGANNDLLPQLSLINN